MALWHNWIDDSTGDGASTLTGMQANGLTFGVRVSTELPPLPGITTISSSGQLHVAGTLKVDGQLLDGDGNFGTSGRVLSSDGTDTRWVESSTLAAGAAAQVATNTSTSNTTNFLTYLGSSSGNNSVNVNSGLSVNPSTNVLTASGFVGTLTGNVTGNVTGNLTGNADTATAVNINEDNSNSNRQILFVPVNSTGNVAPLIDTNDGHFLYNPSTNVLSGLTQVNATTFVGALSGNASTATQCVNLNNHDTADLSEGSSNQYFTTARARSSISATGSISYNSSTGVISFTAASDTDNVAEGSSNLYHTTGRARGAISAGGDLSYNNSTGVISYTTPVTVTNAENVRIRTDSGDAFHNIVFVDSTTDNQNQVLKMDDEASRLQWNPHTETLVAQAVASVRMLDWGGSYGSSGQVLTSKGTSQWAWESNISGNAATATSATSATTATNADHVWMNARSDNTNFACLFSESGVTSTDAYRGVCHDTQNYWYNPSTNILSVPGLTTYDAGTSLSGTATGVIASIGDGGASGDRCIQFKRSSRTTDINLQAINSGSQATTLNLNQEGGTVTINGRDVHIPRAWCSFTSSGSGSIYDNYNVSSISEPNNSTWQLNYTTSWAGGSNDEKNYVVINATGAESNHWVNRRYRDYCWIKAGGNHQTTQALVVYDG